LRLGQRVARLVPPDDQRAVAAAATDAEADAAAAQVVVAADAAAEGAADAAAGALVEALAAAVVQRLLFCVEVNAFGVGDDLGAGLFAFSAMLNHSCLETATHYWADDADADARSRSSLSGEGGGGGGGSAGVLVFRAVEPLARGAEVCHSYAAGLHLATRARTAPLRKHKFFTCSCARCADPAEGGRASGPLGAAWGARLADASGSGSGCAEVPLRRTLVRHAEALFPRFHVGKGVVHEQLALALDRRTAEALDANAAAPGAGAGDAAWAATAEALAEAVLETAAAREAAQRNYAVCRGPNSALVQRVLAAAGAAARALELLARKGAAEAAAAAPSSEAAEADDDDDDDDGGEGGVGASDLPLLDVVLEVKTWERLTRAQLAALHADLVAHCCRGQAGVAWSRDFRVVEGMQGYGILVLVVWCRVDERVAEPEGVRDDVEQYFGEREEDEGPVQSVDVALYRRVGADEESGFRPA
jgi:hypothetical protein